jgi:hypothetical protein
MSEEVTTALQPVAERFKPVYTPRQMSTMASSLPRIGKEQCQRNHTNGCKREHTSVARAMHCRHSPPPSMVPPRAAQAVPPAPAALSHRCLYAPAMRPASAAASLSLHGARVQDIPRAVWGICGT